MKNKALVNIVAPLFLVFLVLVLAIPRSSKFSYEYRKGRVWKYETLFAEFDFPIYKTDEQMREERGNTSSEVIPFYKYSPDVVNNSIKGIAGLQLGKLRNAVESDIITIYAKGVISDDDVKKSKGTSATGVIYIQKDKRISKIPVSEVYRQSDARAKLLADIIAVSDADVDSIFRAVGVYDLIVPNVIYDEQTTQLVHTESKTTISPTSGYVNAGQLIVSKGEIVTAEIEQMLDSYKREFEANVGYLGPPILLVLGNMLIAGAIVALLFFAVYFNGRQLFEDSRYRYILLVFLLIALTTLVLVKFNGELLYFVPFTLTALMLQAFMKPRVIVSVYAISLVPLLIFSHDGPALFVMFFLAGMAGIYFFKFFQRGWKQFINALITFAVLALVYLGFRASDMLAGNIWMALLSLLIGSLLTVAGYPLVYLFERLFNLVSNSRLVELCEMSNPLVRELEQKAPGTFQHSLQVMNMADFVARAIDVNPDLLRAGAMYHDIGKITNPLCFVENESLIAKDDEPKYHSGLTPLQSAHDIIRHVSDGVELARKHHLPDVIVDFIRTHHGTTTVRYFYEKYLRGGGDPANAPEFRYNAGIPQTKAQIVLMLCDSTEAASRTIKDRTAKGYSDFVESIVAGKMEEGQFEKADISISELGIVKETLKQYLAQANHDRIVYPKHKLIKNSYESITKPN